MLAYGNKCYHMYYILTYEAYAASEHMLPHVSL